MNCAESHFHTHLPPWKGLQLGVGRCVLPGSQRCTLLMHKTLQDFTAPSHAPRKTGTHWGCWRSCGAVKKGAHCLQDQFLAQLLRFAAGADLLVVLLLQTSRSHHCRRHFTVLRFCWEASRLFPALLCRSNLGWYSLERFLLCIDFLKSVSIRGAALCQIRLVVSVSESCAMGSDATPRNEVQLVYLGLCAILLKTA